MSKRMYFFVALCVILAGCTTIYAAQERVAVIGSGGAGLTTTWLLDQNYNVTLYESQNRLGGHANTVEVAVDGNLVPMEAGFEFISETFYPHFYNLLKNILHVPLHSYTMTTTYYHTDGGDVLSLPPLHDGKIEWGSFSPHHIVTMVEFNHLLDSVVDIIDHRDVGITLENFVEDLWLTRGFKDEFLYPFLAANWGVTVPVIKRFSAYDALKYTLEGKEMKDYQWLEIVGGTQQYIKALAAQLQNSTIKLSAQITSISYENGLYTITEADGTSTQFDYLIVGTNAKSAAQLLAGIRDAAPIRQILSQIEFFHTTIAIHGDPRFMPPNPKDWRVVNIRYDGNYSAMTAHKEWISPSSPVFKSWITFDVRAQNDEGGAMPSPLYALAEYEHPVADLNYFNAQKAIAMVQGLNNLWFVGNYTYDNDSHESAIISAIKVGEQLAPQSNRLRQIKNIE